MEKFFIIGFNKTATTTLAHLFGKSGYKSHHGIKWPDNPNSWERYDVFSDGTHTGGKFKKYHEKYPDAKFILNTRRFDKWIISRFKHGFATKKMKWKKVNYWAWPPTRDKVERWYRIRIDHYLDVFEFFKHKQELLSIVNIDAPGWEEHVIAKFELNIPTGTNTHKNRRASKSNPKLKEIVDTANGFMDDMGLTEQSRMFTLLPENMMSEYEFIDNLYLK